MTHTPLDSFESALLTELRLHAAQTPASRHTSRRRRRLVATAAVGLAASVVALVGIGGNGGPSPAYAVELGTDGDIVVIVHRLDDAAGLEDALREQGIDADVRYDAAARTTFGIGAGGDTGADETSDKYLHQVPDGGSIVVAVPDGRDQFSGEDLCGLDAEPASLGRQGDDWVLRIPAGSPLRDRHVEIGTDAKGGLTVFYAGDEPGTACGVVQPSEQD